MNDERATRAVRASLLWIIGVVMGACGGAPADELSEEDSGATEVLDAARTPGERATEGIVTRSPAEWTLLLSADTRTLEPAARAALSLAHPSPDERTALSADDAMERETTALRLNLRAHPTLARLHYSHGVRAERTVGEVLASGTDAHAISDANLSFAHGQDRSILVAWVETAMCAGDGGATSTTSGPEAHRCRALDAPCMRGMLTLSGCCTASLLAAGTVCGEGASCNGEGACVETTQPSASSAPPWLTVFANGLPARGLEPTLVPEMVSVLTPPPGLPADSLELRAENLELDAAYYDADGNPVGEPGDPHEAPALRAPDTLAIVAPSAAGHGPIMVIASAETEPTPYVAYLGAPGVRALVLAPPPNVHVDRVLALTGDLQTRGTVLVDGTSEGTLALSCAEIGDVSSSVGDAPRCYRDSFGRAVVVGADVSLVWFPGDAPPRDVLASIPNLSFRSVRTPIAAGPGCPSCTLTGAGGHVCAGVMTCSATSAGSCVVRTSETCNGIDDDCDGSIDENGSALCNDGIGCTTDTCMGASGCTRIGAPTLCVTRATCETGVCTGATGTVWSTRAIVASDPIVAAGPSAPTGCSVRLANAWCTNSYDSCICNGVEICDPLFASGPIGCLGPPAIRPGTSLAVDPCDDDGHFCTVERACCEPSGWCRADHELSLTPEGPALLGARQAACRLPGHVARTSTAIVDTATTRVWPAGIGTLDCTAASPTGGYPRCANDGNPCTSPAWCSNTTGCHGDTPITLGASVSVAEPTYGGIPSTTCTGSVPSSWDCMRYACDGTGNCEAMAATVTSSTPHPADFTTPACSAFTFNDWCTTAGCETAIPADGGPSTASCAPGTYPSASRCSFPASCGTTGVRCSLPSSSTEIPDVRFGCHPPPSLCYLPGPVNGVADGTCVGTGTRQGTVGDAACHTCDPSRNEFGYSNLPAGTACSVCTGSGCSCYTGACSADGRCLATCHADWPNCYDVCTPF